MTRQSLQLLLLFVFLTNANELFAQAKYEGFGSATPGGKKIVHVTNLNSKGPCSLHEAIGSNGTIVFDIGGTVTNFRWDASVENIVISYLTIDGSKVLPTGITFSDNYNGNGLSFQNSCHDVNVNNIRVRGAGNNGFNLLNKCHDIVFDHCSSSNNGDEGLDITDRCYNITVQYCISGNGCYANYISWYYSIRSGDCNCKENQEQVIFVNRPKSI